MHRSFGRRLLLAALASCTLLSAALSQAQTPTADDIANRLVVHDRARRTALAAYTSDRTYQMDYKGPLGTRHATVHARMDYSLQDGKRFTILSETGSTIFCHQIIRRLMDAEQEGALPVNQQRSILSPENDLFILAAKDEADRSPAWVVEVTPRVETHFNFKGRVWIDQDDYAVARIVGVPAKNPSFFMGTSSFDFLYRRCGQFWLPDKSVTLSHLRIGGDITLKIDYGAYTILPAPTGQSIASSVQSPSTDLRSTKSAPLPALQ